MTGIDLGAAPEKGSGKGLLNLGLGDPSVYGNFPPPPQALAAISASLHSGKADGYPASVGYSDARAAVANYFDEGPEGNWRITEKDIVMTHGASGALEMVSRGLLSRVVTSALPIDLKADSHVLHRPWPCSPTRARTSFSPSRCSRRTRR